MSNIQKRTKDRFLLVDTKLYRVVTFDLIIITLMNSFCYHVTCSQIANVKINAYILSIRHVKAILRSYLLLILVQNSNKHR